jgi:hypothetical protein
MGVHYSTAHGGRDHMTVHVLRPSGETAFFIKAASGERGAALADNAHRVIRLLREHPFRSLRAPVVARYLAEGQVRVAVEKPLWPASLRPSSALTESHARAFGELMRLTSSRMRFRDSPFAGVVQETLALLQGSMEGAERWSGVRRTVGAATAALADVELPFGVCHRESSGHCLVRDGRVHIIDWETAEVSYPPFLDLFKLALYRRASRAEELVGRAAGVLFRGGAAADRIRSYGTQVGVGPWEAYLLFPLFLVDQLRMRLAGGADPDGSVVALLLALTGDERFAFKHWLGGGDQGPVPGYASLTSPGSQRVR